MRNCNKAQEVDRYGKLLPKLIPVEGRTPESAEQHIDHVECQDLKQRVSPELPETSKQYEYTQDKYDSGEKAVGITIVPKDKITAQESAVCCQQKEREYSFKMFGKGQLRAAR